MQRSLGSKVTVEKDGWTDGRTETIVGLFLPRSHANAVGNNKDYIVQTCMLALFTIATTTAIAT